MEIQASKQGGVTVVSVSGSVDAHTAPDLGSFLSGQVQAGEAQLVLDLESMEFTSSAGLRVLIAAAKEARQSGGDLRLAAMQAPVFRVMELSGFTSILKHFKDVESAVRSFGGEQS